MNWSGEEINRWIRYHGDISGAMTAERTALESQLIPVSAYILISAVECYRRHPEMIPVIDRAMAAEDIGAAGRRPGTQVNAVNLWSIVNIPLLGRQILNALGMIGADHEPQRLATIFDFWKRAAAAYRGDGLLTAWDAAMVLTPYEGEVVDELLEGSKPVSGDALDRIRRLNATLMSYLFLLYFDTRAGIGDTGPYKLDDGSVLLVRDFSKLGVSDFWWSEEVAAGLPYSNLTAAFVLEGVTLEVNDWGTSVTEPETYLDRMERFGLFTTDRGPLERVEVDLDTLTQGVREARSRLYRKIASMSRNERIDAGAYVYFSFLRAFAQVAGVARELDWTVPKESLDVYEVLSQFEGSGRSERDPSTPYYLPLP